VLTFLTVLTMGMVMTLVGVLADARGDEATASSDAKHLLHGVRIRVPR